MAEEEAKKVEYESPSKPPPPAPAAPEEAPKDETQEKAVTPPPSSEDKPNESKALTVVETRNTSYSSSVCLARNKTKENYFFLFNIEFYKVF